MARGLTRLRGCDLVIARREVPAIMSLAQLCVQEEDMTWKAPRIVVIRVGMEINCYACADI